MEEHLVKTTTGVVRGTEREGRIDYLGIPYAEAPVGELRFKRSVPKTPWEGVFDAKDYGPAPIQYNNGKAMGEED
jgi:para-nitrobenzyl esterase